MKYIVLVGDGMGDRPIEELDGKTPLESAKTPNMNFIAEKGRVGLTNMIPASLAPASDVANLSILGYNPRKYYTGRGPLEAANMGIDIKDDEVAFRCNLVTISDLKMVDYSAGHISSEEAATLINELNSRMGREDMRFYAGVSYRHLLVFKTKDKEDLKGFLRIKCMPPHDITGNNIKKYLPRKGEHADFINRLMEESREVLTGHEVNKVRLDLKENPANTIWLWGQGTRPSMPRFSEHFGVEGSIISAVDLIKGIGKTIGLRVIDVPGATGYYDTNYLGKAQYALDSLKDRDFVFVHVEAPDEAGHNGDLREKIAAIEKFDKLVVGTVLDRFKSSNEEFRILVLSDHATPISLRTHSRDYVCFAMYGTDIEQDSIMYFNEREARSSKFRIDRGYELMEFFIK
ncbi:MAG: cofactor-independent phosphoglycerate mutase [Candidatus Omnitrophica bacterium]|nr:cofactor-independent phosphoglycerate mutase [Candidatus Omnitrophota bacterium]MBU1933560.1 cofactor-independent phosphoglycerate mutase [Candidatus Omnitrophota bacterium]